MSQPTSSQFRPEMSLNLFGLCDFKAMGSAVLPSKTVVQVERKMPC